MGVRWVCRLPPGIAKGQNQEQEDAPATILEQSPWMIQEVKSTDNKRQQKATDCQLGAVSRETQQPLQLGHQSKPGSTRGGNLSHLRVPVPQAPGAGCPAIPCFPESLQG